MLTLYSLWMNTFMIAEKSIINCHCDESVPRTFGDYHTAKLEEAISLFQFCSIALLISNEWIHSWLPRNQ